MFSVIIASYNLERYIATAIESILAQTYPHWELLIVDDASTDGSVALARSYAARDSRIRVIEKCANSGISETTNLGVQEARYEWIVILDADDIAMPERLAHYAEAIAASPHVIAWGGISHYFTDRNPLISVNDVGPKTEDEFCQWRERGQPIVHLHSTLAFRRSIALRMGGYHTEYNAVPDLDFMDRLSDYGYMLTLPHVLARRRMHRASTTSRRFHEQSFQIRAIEARRKQQNEGCPPLSLEQYAEQERARSWVHRLQGRLFDWSRYYWFQTGYALSDRQFPAAGLYLGAAFLCNPADIVYRIQRQIRLRHAAA